jgi:dTDP-glucose pyrophosphorylase/predicted transcriptional regulator
MTALIESMVIIMPTQTLKQAMEVLNQSKYHICFVVGPDSKLIGSLTDGDIRRAFLKGANLESVVQDYMNPSPKMVEEGISMEEIVKRMNTWGVRQIPVVNSKGVIVKVEIVESLMNLFQKPNRVILMAGGFGKRLSPLTDHIPKPLLQVDGTPILEHILRRFKELGFYKFTISVNYKAGMIVDYLEDGSKLGIEIDYLYEDKPLGTCGALSLLKDKPTEPFFVMNADLLTRANFSTILEYHNANDSFATMCVREHSVEVPYGVVKMDQNNKILSIEEKPKETNYINAGIYVLSPQILDHINSGDYLDMPTLFTNLNKKDVSSLSYILREYWLDIGRMEDFHKAQTEYEKYYKL